MSQIPPISEPDRAAQLFLLYKAALEKEFGRGILNRELAALLGIHEVTVSELLSGKRKRVTVEWITRVMLQLPPEHRYEPFESLLALESEYHLWRQLSPLGESVAAGPEGMGTRFVAPNMRLGKAGGYFYVMRGKETLRIPKTKASQILEHLSHVDEDAKGAKGAKALAR
jgi:plasmid maintenance system antidote protein VapI